MERDKKGSHAGARAGAAAIVLAAAAAFSACGVDEEPDLVAGKQQFVQKCGSCHTLARAGTKGTAGPDLDAAFVRGKQDGFDDKSVEGVVRQQIMNPSLSGVTGTGSMPADLVKGDAVDDVAAYVAKVAGEGGEDTGLLATAVKAAGSGKPFVAENGLLDIVADPSGQLAYTSSKAEAPAGELTIKMTNDSGVPHDVVIDGKGRTEVVDSGASEFKARFTAGTYTFYCSVQGHRQAGMEGELTVG